MDVFCYSPQHFNNLCVLARTLEVFGVARCFIYDPNRLIREHYGNSYARRLRAISAGAFFKIQFERVDDPEAFIGSQSRRSIATVADQAADSLYDFTFQQSDLLVFGSEGTGLPPSVIDRCDHQVTIPQFGVTQSLNLCVASGIFLAEFGRQRGKYGDNRSR